MNFEEAVSAHPRWKTRLRLAIDWKSTKALDSNVVCKDHLCDLGKWIHGEGGQSMGAKPEFMAVKAAHADFHQVARSVLRKALAGDKAGTSILLDGECYQASSKIIQAITKCKTVCN